MDVRPVTPRDAPVVRNVIVAAFGREDEADLVERLRVERAMLAEHLAESSGEVIGHVAFSRLRAEASEEVRVAALAPVSVKPERQGQGVGAALIRAGLEALGSAGEDAVIVLGDPGYYGRFGFSAKTTNGIEAPFKGPAFMGLALRAGALAKVRSVRYPFAFGTETQKQGG